MTSRRTSTASMKAKGQFPSDRETLQDSVELIFGPDPSKMREMAAVCVRIIVRCWVLAPGVVCVDCGVCRWGWMGRDRGCPVCLTVHGV